MSEQFNREQFEAQARAAAPPLPEGGIVRAKDDLWDRTWFQWVFWPAVIIGISVVGPLLNEVLS